MKLGTSADLWGLSNNRYRGIHEKSSKMSKLEFIKIAESAFFLLIFFLCRLLSQFTLSTTQDPLLILEVFRKVIFNQATAECYVN